MNAAMLRTAAGLLEEAADEDDAHAARATVALAVATAVQAMPVEHRARTVGLLESMALADVPAALRKMRLPSADAVREARETA